MSVSDSQVIHHKETLFGALPSVVSSSVVSINTARVRPLRLIALVPPDQQGRGASRYTFLSEELEGFAARGVEVHTASPYVTRTTTCGNLQIHPLPSFRNLRATVGGILSFRDKRKSELLSQSSWIASLRAARQQQGIARILRDRKIDLIYSPFAWPLGIAGVPAAMETGTPVVVSLRGADILVEQSIDYGQMLDQLYARRFSRVLQSAAHVIAVSQALADAAVALGCQSDHVSVVLKGVDTNRFFSEPTEAARRRLGIPNRPTILFVGNFVRSKGIGVLIDAFAALHARRPESQLVLCGDGPEGAALQVHVDRLQLGPHVRFAGRISRGEIPDYFRAADVFVLPSLTEGSGNVLVEAGACGKPLVGASVGGIPDYIDDGITGFLFEKRNATDLSHKLLRLVDDPQLAGQMGAAARQRVIRLHQYDDTLDRIVTIFDRVLASRGEQR